MRLRRRSLRFVTGVVVVALPLLGMSGVASAKVKGCHKTHTCKSAGGTGSGGATGGTAALITVQVDPNPLVETGQSDVLAIVQVETSPSLAGDTVTVSSSQLAAGCLASYFSFASPAGTLMDYVGSIPLTLDDDGNATTVMFGVNCAPGSDVVEASLDSAPYDTALTTLDVEPPVVTTPGVFGYPTTSGTVTGGEVETGGSGLPDVSDIYAVFYVETDPVYAEQTVEISSPQLEDRCNLAFADTGFESFNGNGVDTATLDDDGNAVFVFVGASCAAGSSVVTADVEAGTHPTYTTTFTVLPPQPTI